MYDGVLCFNSYIILTLKPLCLIKQTAKNMNGQTTTDCTFGGACPNGQRADATLEVGSCIVNRRSVYYICDGADRVSFSQTHYMYFSAIITVLKLQIHHELEAFPYCNTAADT